MAGGAPERRPDGQLSPSPGPQSISPEAGRHVASRVKLARVAGEARCPRVNKADGPRRSSRPGPDSCSSVLKSPHVAFLSTFHCCHRGAPLPSENMLMSSWNT